MPTGPVTGSTASSWTGRRVGAAKRSEVLADLETWQGATAAVDAALARHGRIDVAIHTVGGTIWAKPYQHYTPAEIDRSFAQHRELIDALRTH